MTSPKTSHKNKADLKPNGETFRLLFTNHPIPMWIYDLKTLAFLDVNDAALGKYGYTRDEFLVLTLKDIRPSEETERLIHDLEKERPPLQNSGEWRHQLKNGQIIDVEITSHTLEFERHKAVLVMAQDITERKQAEQVLHEKNTLQEQIVKIAETVPGGMYSVQQYADGATTMPYVSPTWEELWGLKQEDVQGNSKPAFDLIHPDDVEYVLKISMESAATLCPMHGEFRILNPVKGEIWVESRSAPIRQPDGSILWHGVTTDITERKRAEGELKESEKRFATIFRANPAAIAMTRLDDGCLVDVNAAWQRITGYVHSEVVGRTPQELNLWVHPEQRERLIEKVGEQGKAHGEIQLRCKSGEVRDLLMSADLIKLDGKRYLLTMSQDITESKKAQALRQNFYNMLNASLNEIYIFDAQTLQFEFVSAGAISNLGYSLDELRRMTPLDLKPEITLEAFATLINPLRLGTAPVINFETVHRRADGTQYPVEIHLQLFSQADHPVFMAVILDITERKLAEEALRQSEALLAESQRIGKLGHAEWIKAKDELICSNEMLRIFELPCDNRIISRNMIGEMVHPEDRKRLKEIDRKLFAERADLDYEYRILPSDNKTHWIQQHSQITYDKNGAPIRMIGVFQDITERKQAEGALAESEKKFRALFETMSEGVVYEDCDGKIISANPAAERLLGLSFDQMQGRTSVDPRWKAIHADGSPFPGETHSLNLAAKTGKPATGEVMGIYNPKSDACIWLSVNSTPEFLPGEKKPFRAYAVFRDISEQKQAEETLRESERKLREAQEMAHLGFWRWNVKTGDVEWSDEVFKIFCLDPKEFTPQIDSILALSPWPEDHQRGRELINRAIESHSLGSYEQRFLRPDQSIGHYYSTFQGNYAENGDLISIVGTVLDITKRKQAEETLRETSERLTHMLANSPTVIYALKVEGGKANPIWVSDNINAVLGFNAEDGLKPEWWSQQIHPEDRTNALVSLEHLFDGFYQHEYRFLRKDGSVIWLHDEHRLLRDEDNKPREIIGAWTDVTEHKQAEELLQEYSTRLADEVQARTTELCEAQEKLVRNEKLAVLGQLAGGVGHELRNPLAVINNALYYLKLIGADSSEKVKEYLGIIQTETRTAEKIITDLLDFARIKSVDLEPVSASKLTARVLERYPAPKAVSVRLEIPEGLPKLYVDPRQMEQVLGNLIVNACQTMCVGGVSAGGELTITARQEQEMIAVAVKDTGLGIPPENMKLLFEPLFTTKAKGIGLGLAVSQKLTEANGGRIEVESEAGMGSTFTVYLPIHKR